MDQKGAVNMALIANDDKEFREMFTSSEGFNRFHPVLLLISCKTHLPKALSVKLLVFKIIGIQDQTVPYNVVLKQEIMYLKMKNKGKIINYSFLIFPEKL